MCQNVDIRFEVYSDVVDKPTYEKEVQAFYAKEGRHFGALDSNLNPQLVEAGYKDGAAAYVSRLA
jgi:hypothetical protein